MPAIFCTKCDDEFRTSSRNTWDYCPECGESYGVHAPKERLAPVSVPEDLSEVAEPKPRRRRRYRMITAGIVLFIATAIGIVVLIDELEDDERVPYVPRQALAENLKDFYLFSEPLDPEPLKEELKPFFQELGTAFREPDHGGLVAFFDVDRMVEEFEDVGPPLPQLAWKRRTFVSEAYTGFTVTLERYATSWKWTRTEIRKIQPLNAGEIIVITTHENPDGGVLKLRWWLTCRTGVWKVYDLEEIEIGIRFSTSVAVVLLKNTGFTTGIVEVVEWLEDASRSLAMAKDVDRAEKNLEQVQADDLPDELKAERFMLQGTVHLHRKRYAESIESLEGARALRPDMPILDLLQGMALNRTGKWDEAWKHLQAYRTLFGDDDIVRSELGLALRGLLCSEEFVASYRRLLDRYASFFLTKPSAPPP